MVWVKLIIIIFSYSFILNASNLSNEEINYFNILDLNNDGFVSLEEINQSASIIFQLIDMTIFKFKHALYFIFYGTIT